VIPAAGSASRWLEVLIAWPESNLNLHHKQLHSQFGHDPRGRSLGDSFPVLDVDLSWPNEAALSRQIPTTTRRSERISEQLQ